MLSQKVRGAGGAKAAPSFEFVGAFSGASSVTVAASNIEEGDLMIASMLYYSNVNISPESDWTQVYDALYNTYHSVNVSYKRATAADALNGVTINNGNRHNIILIFRPVNNTTLPTLYHEVGTINSTAQTSANIPADKASVWVGIVGWIVSYNSHSFSPGVTEGTLDVSNGLYAYSINPAGNSLGSQYSQVNAGFEYAWSGCFTIE